MRLSSRLRFRGLLASVVLVAVGSSGPAYAGSVPVLYETFGANGVAAINLSTPPTGLGSLFDNATNIVAGGGKVYFESGNTIYSTSTNLVGLNTVLTNGQAATGLALDAADGILYETFGPNGISAIDLNNPSMSLGNLFDNATNIVAGGGKVYFESGNTIYSTSTNLVGLNTGAHQRPGPHGTGAGRRRRHPLRDVRPPWDIGDQPEQSLDGTRQPEH